MPIATGAQSCGWVTPYRFGIDQGPAVLTVQNYRSGLLWNLMRRSPPVVAGLRRAGFTGAWLWLRTFRRPGVRPCRPPRRAA